MAAMVGVKLTETHENIYNDRGRRGNPRFDLTNPNSPRGAIWSLDWLESSGARMGYIYIIYTIGKLESTPTKVETNPKLDGDYTDEDRGKHVK